MKCEKCGKDLRYLEVDMFDYNGDWYTFKLLFKDYGNTVVLEVDDHWAGYELSANEKLKTICCPYCKQFPFENEEIQEHNFVRLVMFKDSEITEHFDNPSLSSRDIVNDYLARPIWDETLQEWCIVDNFNLQFKTINLAYTDQSVKREFEDGRYYRREVKENE